MTDTRPDNGRVEPRMQVDAPYSSVRLRLAGDPGDYEASGHVYDVSLSGLRFEVDRSVPAGSEVELRASLPGQEPTTIKAKARIVRLASDEDEPGPARHGAVFTGFRTPMDRHRLLEYMALRGVQRAGAIRHAA